MSWWAYTGPAAPVRSRWRLAAGLMVPWPGGPPLFSGADGLPGRPTKPGWSQLAGERGDLAPILDSGITGRRGVSAARLPDSGEEMRPDDPGVLEELGNE